MAACLKNHHSETVNFILAVSSSTTFSLTHTSNSSDLVFCLCHGGRKFVFTGKQQLWQDFFRCSNIYSASLKTGWSTEKCVRLKSLRIQSSSFWKQREHSLTSVRNRTGPQKQLTFCPAWTKLHKLHARHPCQGLECREVHKPPGSSISEVGSSHFSSRGLFCSLPLQFFHQGVLSLHLSSPARSYPADTTRAGRNWATSPQCLHGPVPAPGRCSTSRLALLLQGGHCMLHWCNREFPGSIY